MASTPRAAVIKNAKAVGSTVIMRGTENARIGEATVVASVLGTLQVNPDKVYDGVLSVVKMHIGVAGCDYAVICDEQIIHDGEGFVMFRKLSDAAKYIGE